MSANHEIPDLLGALQRSVDAAKAARRATEDETPASSDDTEARMAIAEALHARIDGDYLLGGGGWDRDGWVDDIPHDRARISDIVRWASLAIAPLLAERERAAEARALQEAADAWRAAQSHRATDAQPDPVERWLRDRIEAQR